MKKTKEERLNWWKVTVTILLIGGLCWLALFMFGCVSLVNFGKGDQEYKTAEDKQIVVEDGTNKISEFHLKLSPH